MLRSINEITGRYKLLAEDGDIGKIKDFYFNDKFWNIKYLVADTAGWLTERLVLISPAALGHADWISERLSTNLTKEKIENSPPVEKDQPVSRQKESELIKYYAWPMHFAYGVDTAHFAQMQLMAERMKQEEEEQKNAGKEEQGDPHLRSAGEVSGYSIKATDDSIGHVEDFIFEDDTWIIRYLVVDTRKWLPGQKKLVSPEWVKDVDWVREEVSVDMNKNSIENSPEYDPSEPVNRKYEVKLYDYYGRPKYWENR